MKRDIRITAIFLLLWPAAWGTGCASRSPVLSVPVAGDSVGRLHADLEQIFSDPNFAAAQWGVKVMSLDKGDLLFERNGSRLYMPASNNKVLTAAVALIRLGPDFRFQTEILATGSISGGTLHGDIAVVGSGDPSNAARLLDQDPLRNFRGWGARLKDMGITRIEGRLIGDEGAFSDPKFGRGWAWDDLEYSYASPVSALQFNENAVTLEFSPGSAAGAPARVSAAPLPDYLSVDSKVVTASAGSEARLLLARDSVEETVLVRGSVPLGGSPVRRTVAVRYPGRFYLRSLRHALESQGIVITGEDTVVRGFDRTQCRILFTHASPPLSEILKPLLKISQNLYAETLARAIGLGSGEGSFEKAKEIVAEVLRGMAIEEGMYSYADGSGLSRLNLLSADVLVRLFRFMYRHRHFTPFYEALPIAGIDGTIENRMKGTKAANNVRAKTGTLAHVRALSGYIRTADGELLAFAMLANNFLVSSRAAEYVQDSALERLANFRRAR